MRTDIHIARTFLLHDGKNATSHPRNPFLAPDTPLNRNLHGHRRCPYGRLRATTAGEDRKKINEDEEEKYRLWSQERRKWWAWGNIVGNYGAEETNTSNTRERENAWLIFRDNAVNGRSPMRKGRADFWALLFLDSSARHQSVYIVVTPRLLSLDASRLMCFYRYSLRVLITITINIRHECLTNNKSGKASDRR